MYDAPETGRRVRIQLVPICIQNLSILLFIKGGIRRDFRQNFESKLALYGSTSGERPSAKGEALVITPPRQEELLSEKTR
ncbi:hypothetical protein Desti_5609 [Desulfomonile tiedjei DSM 6799]|uniref:Uncharacterized protein n=1 Tax=Desulfomonile tiedjei (strain ATCC 49306 / DSM 6799 / DCB-1) TaxID=706587 RepID=I4CF48_DESTA|nr:hypothetical protein Desti_5609 [Desulfomonile tiedjei DSM 6799]